MPHLRDGFRTLAPRGLDSALDRRLGFWHSFEWQQRIRFFAHLASRLPGVLAPSSVGIRVAALIHKHEPEPSHGVVAES
jgi:hypothetical protein